jgi:hypothetical protein
MTMIGLSHPAGGPVGAGGRPARPASAGRGADTRRHAALGLRGRHVDDNATAPAAARRFERVPRAEASA